MRYSGRANPDFDLLSALPEKPGLRQRVEEQIGLELSDPLDRLIAAHEPFTIRSRARCSN